MGSRSAIALITFSAICLVAGVTTMSPGGGFSAIVLAVLCAALPAMFARRWIRCAALAILAVSAISAVLVYPSFRQDQIRYRERAEKASADALNPDSQRLHAVPQK